MKKLFALSAFVFLALLALPAPALAHSTPVGLIMLPLQGIWFLLLVLGIALLVVIFTKVKSPWTASLIVIINSFLLYQLYRLYFANAFHYTYAIRRGTHPSHLFANEFMMFAAVSIGIILVLVIIAAAFKMKWFKYIVFAALAAGGYFVFCVTMPKLRAEQKTTELIENIDQRPYLYGKDLPEGEHDMSGLKDLSPELKRFSFYKAAEEGNIEVVKMLIGDMSAEENTAAFA